MSDCHLGNLRKSRDFNKKSAQLNFTNKRIIMNGLFAYIKYKAFLREKVKNYLSLSQGNPNILLSSYFIIIYIY